MSDVGGNRDSPIPQDQMKYFFNGRSVALISNFSKLPPPDPFHLNELLTENIRTVLNIRKMGIHLIPRL